MKSAFVRATGMHIIRRRLLSIPGNLGAMIATFGPSGQVQPTAANPAPAIERADQLLWTEWVIRSRVQATR